MLDVLNAVLNIYKHYLYVYTHTQKIAILHGLVTVFWTSTFPPVPLPPNCLAGEDVCMLDSTVHDNFSS